MPISALYFVASFFFLICSDPRASHRFPLRSRFVNSYYLRPSLLLTIREYSNIDILILPQSKTRLLYSAILHTPFSGGKIYRFLPASIHLSVELASWQRKSDTRNQANQTRNWDEKKGRITEPNTLLNAEP